MSVEVEGMRELESDLAAVPGEVIAEAERIVGKGCSNIKRDWQARWRGLGPHLPHIARSITYDVDSKGETVVGEVGPTRGRLQGRLGSFIELGTLTSGPHPGGLPALAAEEPNFFRYAAEVKLRVLGDRA